MRADPDATRPATLLEKLARQVPGVLYQYQLFPDGRSCFPFATHGLEDVYEVRPDEVLLDATPVFGRLHPDDLARVAESITVSATTLEPWRCTYRVCLPVRGERWLQGDARPERLPDGSTLWHGHISDITESARARQALRESEAHYRLLVDAAPEAIVVYDALSERFVDANQHAEQLFDMTRAALLASRVLDVSAAVQPDGRRSEDAAREYIGEALRGGSPVFEWLHRTAGGEQILCEVRLGSLPLAGRTMVRGSITDIRARRRLDDTLRQLEAAIASSLSAIAIADLAGTITYVNQATLSLWGFDTAEDVLGRSVSEFWSDLDAAAEVASALRARGSWNGELTAERANGGTRHLYLQASLFRDADGAPRGMLASFIDITEERHLRAQLEQAQRLETVGRLAGGVAHDFNNLLTVMKGFLELSLSELEPSAPVCANLHEIDHAVESAASLTRQLLAFSRKQAIAPRVLDLDEVVRRTLGMLQRLLGEHISVHYTTRSVVNLVRFDPGQAEQILVNLAANARDAMPDGGSVTIEISQLELDAASAGRHPGIAPGAYVLLRVADTGQGMSPETRDHAFEPFYTTKLPGHGTGLGLAMIHGAVSQNGGHIEIDSEVGRGTAFRIYLPRVDGESVTMREVPPVQVPRGTERILLVEDDRPLRRLTERLLRQFGYEVVAADGGEAALAWLAREEAPVDLLLTDVIMPRMNGKVLADRVCALRPEVRVLFMSGYTANVIEEPTVMRPGVEFLPKPFTMASLALRVREVLDKPPAGETTHGGWRRGGAPG